MSAEPCPQPRPLRLRSGTDYALEEQADALLAESRRGVTALSDKRDYLTHDQLRLRLSREVYNTTGVSDESLAHGLFNRCYNPDFGQRPTRHGYSEDS